jgi:hypothetical protein
LQSPGNRAAVEARLAGDGAARRQVEQVRATARALADALAEESAADAETAGADDLRLTDLQRAAIERRLVEPRPRLTRHATVLRRWPLWGSLAASVAIVATVTATVVVPLLRGTGAGGQPGLGTSGSPDDPTDPARQPAAVLPDVPDAQATSPAAGATRPSWSDLPPEWPRVPDRPFPGAGAPPGDGGDSITRAGPGFVLVTDRPVSACPIGPIYPDGAGPDRGSFAAIRQSLDRGDLPPAELVRTEELINAVAGPYEPRISGDAPAVIVEVAACPWAADHRLVRIAVTTADEKSGQQQPAPAVAPVTAPASSPATGAPGMQDVAVRIDFNPTTAAAYRLIGYNPRPTGAPSAADRGPQAPGPISIPSGRSVTVLYEVILAGQPVPGAAPATAAAGPSKWRSVATKPTGGPELLSVVVRHCDARTGSPRTAEASARDDARAFDAASPAFRAAAAAAALGLTLRGDPLRGSADCDLVLRLLERDRTGDPGGPRAALLQVSLRAKALSRCAAAPRTPRDGS